MTHPQPAQTNEAIAKLITESAKGVWNQQPLYEQICAALDAKDATHEKKLYEADLQCGEALGAKQTELDALRSENARLQARLDEANEQYRQACEIVQGKDDESDKQVATLQARVRELEGVLAWYADEANWESKPIPHQYHPDYIDTHKSAIDFDKGGKARDALGTSA